MPLHSGSFPTCVTSRPQSLKGFVEVVIVLLEYGTNIHAQEDQALISAAHYGHVDVVRVLLEHKADVDAQNNVALLKAVDAGEIEVVRVLLEYGADIHAQCNQALVTAARYSRGGMYELLIAKRRE